MNEAADCGGLELMLGNPKSPRITMPVSQQLPTEPAAQIPSIGDKAIRFPASSSDKLGLGGAPWPTQQSVDFGELGSRPR